MKMMSPCYVHMILKYNHENTATIREIFHDSMSHKQIEHKKYIYVLKSSK